MDSALSMTQTHAIAGMLGNFKTRSAISLRSSTIPKEEKGPVSTFQLPLLILPLVSTLDRNRFR